MNKTFLLMMLCFSVFAEVKYIHPDVQLAIIDNPKKELIIHDEMRAAIELNESLLRRGEEFPEDETFELEGVKRHVGFRPTWDFYRGAKVLNVKADMELIKKFLAAGGRNYKEISYSPVRGQPNGSCWAEGAASAFELNWNAITGLKNIFSSQDIIDCSGFGTARNGGQLSLEYALNGLAYHSDYPYTGRDGTCKRNVERHNPLKQAVLVRGENGGFPKEPELLTAFIKYGAMEGCGSAGAMAGGGRQDTPRRGVTNHCTAVGAAFNGLIRGWLNKIYWGNKNSWGSKSSPDDLNLSGGDWGDDGWGWHVLSNDGVNIVSSVWTEFMIGYAGELRPPTPFNFKVTAGDWEFSVTVDPTKSTFSEAELTESIKSYFN